MNNSLVKNRLSESASPYLLQHQFNPVDWYPWGKEALDRAKRENKPIFLSIGYSSCHWCHVMEREAFSDPQVAAFLKENFISIKLDREERPDLDALYMKAIQAFQGTGGWPLNVFLRPDLKPFFGGTYFPLQARYGQPGFLELLRSLASAWANQDPAIQKNIDGIMNGLVQGSRFFESGQSLETSLPKLAAKNLQSLFDAENGGFGRAPKFFYTDGLRLLLRASHSQKDEKLAAPVWKTLEAITSGGVFDQVGGGFHRYSTDARWKTPHFEKMLYDNALLLRVFVEAWSLTQNPSYKIMADKIISWAFREMKDPAGGYGSAIDADSEHEEGAFYRWNQGEVETVLKDAPQKQKFLERFGFAGEPTFEGFFVPHLEKPLNEVEEREFAPLLDQLRKHRDLRPRPLVDIKKQTSWNSLWVSSLALAGWTFENENYLQEAEKTWSWMWSQGAHQKHILGTSELSPWFLEDAAYFLEAGISLYALTNKKDYFEKSLELGLSLRKSFEDSREGGFYSTNELQDDLLIRSIDLFDSALPSPYAVAVEQMGRLFLLTGDSAWNDCFEKGVKRILKTAETQNGGCHRLALAIGEFMSSKLTLSCEGDSCDWGREFFLREIGSSIRSDHSKLKSQVP